MVTLNVNGKPYEVDVDSDTPLLWAIRDGIGLTGTNMVAASRCAARARCRWMARRRARAACLFPLR
jgi:isoquinoline 1-oxidoreductase alpha subunit